MRFTLNWLKDHLETDASLDEITNKLTMIGLEVESVDNPAEKFAPFTSARVIEAKPHPDADKLSLCRVETKDGEVQVVCGAPNARTGMIGVFAPSGSYVPGIDLTLKPTKIRGVESNGMLVSEREMELSDEHDGIIELHEGTEVGVPFADLMGLNDPVIEIGITPNRPDALGVYGIARDLAAAGLGRLKDGSVDPVVGHGKSPIGVSLKFDAENTSACSQFIGRYIKGIKNGPSPEWLQRRLRAIGLRPISALVDITNYVSYDRGRPLHVFDADKVKGDIHARLAEAGEKLLALDEEEYTLDGTMCVIADDAGAVGIGGVMGGLDSGCTDQTTNVFLEVAYFDPLRIARTGRALGINSDARYRFERGVDAAYLPQATELATRLIMDLCGGEPSKLVTAGEGPHWQKSIEFDHKQVKRLTGLELEEERIIGILASLGFGVAGFGDEKLMVEVPSWRPDVGGQADLVEEVVRIHGLEHVQPKALPRHVAVAEPILTENQNRLRLAKRALAARGLDEAVTWSFVPEEHARAFGAENHIAQLTVENPISSDLDTMRPSILPGIIAAVGRNIDRGFDHVGLFEAGPQYAGDGPDDQSLAISGVRRSSGERHWANPSRAVDAFDAKADALAALAAVGAPLGSVQVTDDAPAWYHPGRSGCIRLGPKNVLATFGEVHPAILDLLDVKGPMVAFEVIPANVPQPKKKTTKSRAPLSASDLPAVTRDFAFVVDGSITAETLLRAAKGADKKLISAAALFDVYEGKGIEDGKKSLAIEVTLQPFDKTLTDEEIEAVAEKVIAQVAKATGGVLRG